MKEESLTTVMQMAGGAIGAHDDRFMLRGNKVVPGTKKPPHPEGVGVGLTMDYWRATEIKRRNGEPVRTGYYRKTPTGREYTSMEKYDDMTPEEAYGWKPVFARGLKLADGIALTIKNNDVELSMDDLYDELGSRYAHALDCMLDMEAAGILKYEPIVDEPTERNRKEAIRNRLKRYMKPTSYEHNIIFIGTLGQAIYADLESRNRLDHGYGSIYLQGATRHKGQTEKAVKFYDVGHRARTKDGERDAKDGEVFKLETTFLRPYFLRLYKDEGFDVADMTGQADIQARLSDELVDSLAQVLGYVSERTLDMVAEALSIDRPNRREAPRLLAQAMLKPELTLAGQVRELQRDMAEVKRRQAQHDRDIEQLKRAQGLK